MRARRRESAMTAVESKPEVPSPFALPDWPCWVTRQVRLADGNGRSGEVNITAWKLPPGYSAGVLGFEPDPAVTVVLQHEDFSRWTEHADVEGVTVGIVSPHPVPGTQLANYGGGAIPYLVILLQMARKRWSPIFGMLRYVRPEGVKYSIEGFTLRARRHRFEALRPAFQAIEFLASVRVQPGGRPKGSRKGQRWDRDDFLQWYREASQSYARDESRTMLDDLKEALGVRSERTVKTRLADAELPWPPESFPGVWEEGW